MPELPPSSPASPPPFEALARQNALLKRVAAFLALVLVGGLAAYLWVRHQEQPVVILLDGRPITTARNASIGEECLRAAETAKLGSAYPKDSIVRLQKVQMERLASSAPIDPTDVARSKLQIALKLHVRTFAIYVDGKPALGLPTDAAASETLHRVKEHFAQLPPQTEILREPEFAERVTVKEAALDAAQARPDAATAAPYFWSPPPSRTYAVRRGDTGIVIARRNHLSLSDLIAANPGADINRLRPGQSIHVQKMPLLLTVQVQKRLTRAEKIIANAPESIAGKRNVTYAVTYINGQETHRDVLNITTVQPPQTRTSL